MEKMQSQYKKTNFSPELKNAEYFTQLQQGTFSPGSNTRLAISGQNSVAITVTNANNSPMSPRSPQWFGAEN